MDMDMDKDGPNRYHFHSVDPVILLLKKKRKNKSGPIPSTSTSTASVSSAPKKNDCKKEDESDVQFLGKSPKFIQDSLQELKSQCDTMSNTMFTSHDMGVRINDLNKIISDLKSHAGIVTPHK